LIYLRAGYVTAQLLSFAIYFAITILVSGSHIESGIASDSVLLQIRRKNDLTVLKYVNPPPATSPDAKPELVTTTVKDYDLSETGKALRGLFVVRTVYSRAVLLHCSIA